MVTEAERERLVILMEECGEVVQACSKILRWGWDSQFEGITNIERLRDEMEDLSAMIWAIGWHDTGGPRSTAEEDWERKKRWMKFQD